jgi:hypothetical protein
MKNMILSILLYLTMVSCGKDPSNVLSASSPSKDTVVSVNNNYVSVTINSISIVDNTVNGSAYMRFATYPTDSLIYYGSPKDKIWKWDLSYTIIDFKKMYNITLFDSLGHKHGYSFQMCVPATMGNFPKSYTFKIKGSTLYVTITMCWNLNNN